jgi:HPt (histidine-containing phosphotransfer) domain-containing protein
MSESPVLDLTVIDTLRQLTPPGEPDVLSEVLKLFLEEVPPRIEKVRIAWTEGNIKEVHRGAHSLKGSAGNVGARRLYDVCKALDTSGTSDAPASAELVDQLAAEYRAVEAEIHQLLKGA